MQSGFSTVTSVILTPIKVIKTQTSENLYSQCDFYMHRCDFDTHKWDTQSVNFTYRRWLSHAEYNFTWTSVIFTRITVILTPVSVIIIFKSVNLTHVISSRIV
jgi:hypothetical protein